MSRAVAKVWKVVVAAKVRAKERAEQALSTERARHARLIEAIDEADARLHAAQGQKQALEDKITGLLTSAEGLSPLTYLDHDRHREKLAQAVIDARAGASQAEEAAQAQARVVAQAAAQRRRADAARDAAREQHQRALSALRRRVDEIVDEEAGEIAAARLQRGGFRGV